MSGATYIIRMQDIQPRQHSILIDTDTRLALRGKKDIAALFIQLLQLRKGISLCDYSIPYAAHLWQILSLII
ncbi:hypothetical protein LI129_22295, partial [Erysipelatoclostridium ramosum]|uniref:hypothetical protein n=1 Tax=Thomasclavelia ramosa TaxID=1547 RepID=UPI001D06A63C